jgi:hypothetical protein
MRLAVAILMLVLAGGVARAEEPPAPKATTAEKKPVRVGPTTVTVIDEHESVDDIISRVRRNRQPRPGATQPPAVVPPPAPPAASPEDGKTKREAKAEERASRKQVRERLQRLRETARDRRANRRGARSE